MEESIDTALLFKQIKEKVLRDGDDQGEVTEELFEEDIEILRRGLRRKMPNDTPSQSEVRTANSLCTYFWNKNGIKRAYELFPDAFEPRSTSKTPEVKTEKLALKQGDPETAKELMESWKAEQAAPPIVPQTLIAGIPLHDWLAEQAEKKATALAEKNAEEAKTKSKSANESKARNNKIYWRNRKDALVKKRKIISAIYRGGVNVNAVAFGDPNPFGLLAKKESKEKLKKEGPTPPTEAESEETSKNVTEGGGDAGGDTSVD
ncbi:hypothetical protein BOTCAL_0114g00300 [Botryotinia calthae]|uniref:Uncharacterized protein n=1 Tax=Botryotinia calthae TaxID=38488 RepID=A0A4Y8D5L5_9HELO|nr:hypothetical protein BOTCAL_0114g00300 [Botryotinia calthae]